MLYKNIEIDAEWLNILQLSHAGALHGAPSPDGVGGTGGGAGVGGRDNESSTNELSDNAGDGLSHHNGSGVGGGRISKKSGNKKPRRRPDSPAAEGDLEKIFIWELDDTILLLGSLLNGKFATQYQKEDQAQKLHSLGYSMETLILELAENSFFHNDLEQCDQIHIDDVCSDEVLQDLSYVYRMHTYKNK